MLPNHQVALFVVGQPGAGKTTLVRRLLGVSPRGELPIGGALHPKPKWTIVPSERYGNVMAAGHYIGAAFDGGDSVGYSGVAEAMSYLARWRAEVALAIFDGDRFSHAGVLAQLRLLNFDIHCAFIDLPDTAAELRRAQRAQGIGAKIQNASWVKGRATKARRFFEMFDDQHQALLDGEDSGDENANALDDYLLDVGLGA